MIDGIDSKYNLHSTHRTGECKFCHNIECDSNSSCITCGWNPVISDARKRAIRKALEKNKPVMWRIGSGAF